MKKLFLLSLLGYATCVSAQRIQIPLKTKNTELLLSVSSDSTLTQTWFGEKLSADNQAMLTGGHEVYVGAGMEDQLEPAIRVVHSDGNPSLDLKYISHDVKEQNGVSTTTIVLKDPVYPVEVDLHYKIYYDEDVMETW